MGACRSIVGYDDDDCESCDGMNGVDLNEVDHSLGVLLDYCDVLDHVSYCSLLIAAFSPCDTLRRDILGLDIAFFFRTADQMVVALDLPPIFSHVVQSSWCHS